jgi:hypothetical protein
LQVIEKKNNFILALCKGEVAFAVGSDLVAIDDFCSNPETE